MQVQLSAEREAQLQAYAARHGQDPSTAIDQILEEALEWDRRDSLEAAAAIREALASVQAGRTRPAADFLNELSVKYGLSR